MDVGHFADSDSRTINLSDNKTIPYSDFHKKLCSYNKEGKFIIRMIRERGTGIEGRTGKPSRYPQKKQKFCQ
jgi:hypothetical protein